MRIIAGEKGGTTLTAPKGMNTRPTLDRVRESLFMILMDRLEDALVLDLFAGAGTLGLEALSRGAMHATFVELSSGGVEALKINIGRLKWRAKTDIVKGDVLRFLGQARAPMSYDLILLDPPYSEGLADRAMKKIAARPDEWVRPGGILAVQVARRDPLEETYGPFARTDTRAYGETRVDFYERIPEPEPATTESEA